MADDINLNKSLHHSLIFDFTPILANGKLGPGQTKLLFLVLPRKELLALQKYQNIVQVKRILPGRNKERSRVGEAIILISIKTNAW